MPKLRPFQREDVNTIKQAGLRVLVASAPGTGKTAVTVVSLAESFPQSFPAVVVCPASVVSHWAREFKTWSPGVNVHIIPDLQATKLPRRVPRETVFILSWAMLEARREELVQLKIRSVVADECHYVKSPDAIRSQALYSLASKVPHLLLLSGTPIVNNHNELDILHSLLGENPVMIRRLIEDVAPDIPPKSRSYVPIQLRPRHQVIYDKANSDFEEWLREEKKRLLGDGYSEADIERTLAAEALAKIGYLRRLVGEFKVPAAADWVARAVRLGEPVVIFLEHQNTLNRLTRALNKQRVRFGVLEGETSPKDRQRLIDGFQKHRFPVFIGTRAAKEGITLTAARHLLFVERFFTSADEEQAEDRIRRIGQTRETTIWYLHAEGTVDDRVDSIVRTKRQIIRDAIGSADTAETPIGNVESLLKTWDAYSKVDRGEVVPLGLGEPLPPLPSPAETHAVVFRGDRWEPRAAAAWCRMHGYRPERYVELAGRFQLEVHPAPVFVPGTFAVHKVSRDVRLITGTRLSRSNERRVRRQLAGER